MYENFNRAEMYYEKDPMKMTEEESKISVAYWKGKYESLRENFVNVQNDLDRICEWILEQEVDKKVN